MNVLVKNKTILENILLANSFWSRFRGYMLRKVPHASGILFITSCSMQTTFMRFNLDIIFIDEHNKVVKVLRNIKPWRFTKIYKGTSKVLEIPANNRPSDFLEGEIIIFSKSTH